jgi:hypothetical protein
MFLSSISNTIAWSLNHHPLQLITPPELSEAAKPAIGNKEK